MIDHGGQNIAEIVAEPLPGEIALQNNRAIAVIEGIRDRLRVLLVSGEPHPGERTWRNLLKADASVDLVHFTILRPPEKQDGTPIKELSLIAFPTRELFVEKLDEFDLIIFDRYQPPGRSADGLSRQCRRLCRQGRRRADRRRTGLRLGRRPLQHAARRCARRRSDRRDHSKAPFSPQVTTIGKRHPVTRGLPGADRRRAAAGAAGSASSMPTPERGETVMSGLDDKPLLVLSREGEGRVAHASLRSRLAVGARL